MKMLIKGGRVIDPANNIDAVKDLLIEDGLISAIGMFDVSSGDVEVIDAKGLVVTPGFIDLHCHLREPGFEYKEDIESGSKSAVAGGYTTICCMPNTSPVNDSAAVTHHIKKRAHEVNLVDILPIGAISKGLKGEELSDIGDLAKAGCVALSDDGKPVMNASMMRRAMEYSLAFSLPIMSHCEDLDLSKDGVMNEGYTSTELGFKGIPALAETAMVMRDLRLSHLTGNRMHIAHVSNAESVEEIRRAKKAGWNISAEVTPHHLLMTEENCSGFDPNTKMKPALGTDRDRKALIEALSDGTIDAIATDHAPHAQVDKEVGFQEAAFGVIGFETTLQVSLKLVQEKKLTLKRMVEALTQMPAKILKFTDRGSFSKGTKADITIFDPEVSVIVDPDKFHSKARNSAFHGWNLKGKVRYTIRDGKVVYK
ncbi:MAG: dihydroorotase, partial [Pseudomonadota bacterium]